MDVPLIVTRDDDLLEELLRLAAAAGVVPEVADSTPAALRSWLSAPLILVGADLAPGLAAVGPPRRAGVHVVVDRPAPDEMFRTALSLGAQSVAGLPESASWVVESLGGLDEHDRAVTIGVVGGSGGAGASTLACAIGQMAGRRGRAVVVDTDPLGPGLDRVLGLEERDGARWGGLQQATGRLSARSLRDALPCRDGVGVLTWAAGAAGTLQAFAVREVLSAAQRGHDTVVVDLPRRIDGVIDEVVSRCDLVVVVVPATLPGVAASARVVAGLGAGRSAGLVVRSPGLDAPAVARLVGAPVLAELGRQRGLQESLDLGLGPVRGTRGPLARAASAVLARARADGRQAASA